MTIRNAIAAAALSTVALLSGTAFAADFGSQLNEAQVASYQVDRETREAVIPALNAAQSFSAWGAQDQAQDYLSYARAKLGLSNVAVIANPVVAAPQATQPVVASSGVSAQVAQDSGIIGLRPEAH